MTKIDVFAIIIYGIPRQEVDMQACFIGHRDVERNYHMIDNSEICMFYYDKNYVTQAKRRSGTQIAYEYAMKKNKKIVNCLNLL